MQTVASLHSKDIDLGLDRFQTLLSRLGNPQDQLPPVVHIAGTNGKGSTLAFLRSTLREVGYSVHSFTSPHLITPHECISLAGEPISEAFYSELLEEIIDKNEGAPLTVFEAQTAAAFLAFSRTKGHVVLLETGLGGTGDCTNVVTQPILTILTPISGDHQEFLGDTIAEIAAHKAGILKEGVPCVMAEQTAEAYPVIRERARTLNVPLYRQGREWFVKGAGHRMVFEGWDGDHAWPLPGLNGPHQIQNAGVALAALEALKDRFNLPEEAIRNGLQHVHWPGRLEQIPHNGLLPDKWELWLDGGHNAAAAISLKAHFKQWRDKPLYLIIGMMKGKDSKSFLYEVGPAATYIYTVPIEDRESKSAEKLAQQVEKQGGDAQACESLKKAFKKLRKCDEPEARVLVCGSLYQLGAVYDLSGRS